MDDLDLGSFSSPIYLKYMHVAWTSRRTDELPMSDLVALAEAYPSCDVIQALLNSRASLAKMFTGLVSEPHELTRIMRECNAVLVDPRAVNYFFPGLGFDTTEWNFCARDDVGFRRATSIALKFGWRSKADTTEFHNRGIDGRAITPMGKINVVTVVHVDIDNEIRGGATVFSEKMLRWILRLFNKALQITVLPAPGTTNTRKHFSER